MSYDHVVALLKVCFGQPHKIVNAHMQALVNTPKPANSLSSLMLLDDTVESNIRAFGKPEDSYYALLVPIFLGKLLPDTRNFAMIQNGPSVTYKWYDGAQST